LKDSPPLTPKQILNELKKLPNPDYIQDRSAIVKIKSYMAYEPSVEVGNDKFTLKAKKMEIENISQTASNKEKDQAAILKVISKRSRKISISV
jgi:hypothetical protein